MHDSTNHRYRIEYGLKKHQAFIPSVLNANLFQATEGRDICHVYMTSHGILADSFRQESGTAQVAKRFFVVKDTRTEWKGTDDHEFVRFLAENDITNTSPDPAHRKPTARQNE